MGGDEFRILCNVAWYSGLRKGEIFAIKASDLRPGYLYVDSQVDKELNMRETKTRGRRKAFILEGGEEWITKWLDIPEAKKKLLRSYNHAKKVRSACSRAFSETDKQCSFHCLRHSYAVHLLSRGVPIAHVAQSLGNSTEVCERYYTGFVLTDESLQLMRQIMEKGPNVARK